ncbi:TPA: hypothetical protein IP933_002623 [Listeria monocytogenes]|uniref:hypothetical protein n=1 Tax=Listeria monocytogenes TaxID=1639 RepID=UPI000775F958|nr:hypothetical protein [Listeria monocytogenes]EHC5259606.1 hypothetical protein [Listeria monocytogenes serotype 1/2a]EAC9604665.1 hypothetical protein [Listeria monocytogenes]EAD4839186.1 hypothetical protein [Listeria monocytogenes]EAE7365525.1 hypothetical protein [Listeria monocytogenes]EAF4462056.1 hypothetical protein [Listeria monocytogenes]
MNFQAKIENMEDLVKRMKEDATDLVNFDLDNQIAKMEERLNYVVNNIDIRKGTEFLIMNALNFDEEPSDYYFEVKEVNNDTFKVLIAFKRKAEFE